ncbi:MAG: FAD-dependent oxidoreductase [Planctomycetes bacterium]|nr:FAD-dependent oxidoreductase [Planctomycetota bacterium]
MAKTPLLRSLLWAHRQILGARRLGMPVDEFVGHAAEVRTRRREFLKHCAGAAALGVGLAALPNGRAEANDFRPHLPTVAIIGGGMAGLNCAWELKKRGIFSTIYEAAPRVSGRILTDRTTFASQGMFSDLGGEYIDTWHTAMLGIARRFNLPMLDYAEDAPLIDSYFDFGGQRRTVQQVLGAYIPIAEAIDAAFDEFDKPNGTVLFDDANGGERLDSLSVRAFLAPINAAPWIKKLVDVAYETEFGLDGDQNNCLNMLYLISTAVKKMQNKGVFDVYGGSDERFHCALGNDAIPRAVADDLAAGQVELQRKLSAVSSRSDGRYCLTFTSGPEVLADHVVFSLPFTMLRSVDLSGVVLPPWKQIAINEMALGQITKVITGHTRPVWREQGFIGNSYSDRFFQTTTETSRMQPGSTGILENYTAGSHALQMAQGSLDSKVSLFHDQVETLFPGLKATYNGNKVRMAWNLYPFTRGAYSSYRVGEYTRFAGAEPLRVGNLHFCGEHTTVEWQGWMEGAARSGKDAAKEIAADLGLETPGKRSRQRPNSLCANG